MSAAFKVVIPARLGSTRLPRKVLLEIGGRPVVQYVWQAAQHSGAEQVIIATDNEEVAVAARAFGADVRLTDVGHISGTDRVNEVALAEGWDADTIVVNLQGDEPLMPPQAIRQAAELLDEDRQADMATLMHPILDPADWLNPNVVKVVCDRRSYALYFSRAPIPWQRDGGSRDAPMLPEGLAFRHIGLYAYRAGRLALLSALPLAALESCEALEQLRALDHGYRIKLGVAAQPPAHGVDTQEDFLSVSRRLSA